MVEHPQINAADGHILPTIHYKHGARKLVVASHGITSEKTEGGIYTTFAESILASNFDVLLFDFRGHGDSPISSKDTTVSGEILDLMAVFRWARAQGYSSIQLVAASFGASILLLAASQYDIKFLTSVVLWNPVISYETTFIRASVSWGRTFFDQTETDELAYRVETWIPDSSFAISAQMTQELLFFHPELTVWPWQVPLLVFHGSSDTLVPWQDAKNYVDRCVSSSHMEFNLVSGVDHGFEDQLQSVMCNTSNWLLKHS